MRVYGWRLCNTILPARRLFFETLERRDLLAVIRLVDWNTLNGPNDAAADANFQTIFEAIGNETIQGNTKQLDILALQETDSAAAGDNSIARIESILDTLYPMTNYASVVSTLDGGGDATGFVYDTETVSLLESFEVSPETLTHHILRGKFRPADTLGESDFYVYSIHLKSGDSGSDQNLRGLEASVLRADADALGEGAHVLFVGDFNMKTSSEDAYANLVDEGAAQLQDVADAPGDWIDNPAFKILHSQDARTSMDDRFDIHFATGEFFDDIGLEYVANSYHVFGNNGTHALNGPITTGSGASPAVLSALVAASDHLPVIADYELLGSTPRVRIVQTGSGTKVIEGGLYDTYSVVLDTIPSANVTVTVTPNSQVDVGNGAGVPIALVFTPSNAFTPQTVIVNAADDAIGEGNHTGLITHSSASADSEYNGIVVPGVTVQIVDDDAPTIVINEIDADQSGTDTMEFVELYDGGVGNASLDGLIVVFFNGNDSNDGSYRTIDLAGRFTDSNGFFVLGNAGVPGVDLIFANNILQNGVDAIALYAAAAIAFPNDTSPTTTNLRDAVVYETITSNPDDAGLLILLEAGQPQVNENQNGTSTTQSLSRVPDDGTPRQTTTYVVRDPTPGALNQVQSPGVLIVHSGSRVDVAEGGVTDSYQIALQSVPTTNVSITVDPDGQTDLGAGAGVAIVLNFTPANSLIPQTVNVTAVDDAAVEGVHASVITHSASSIDSAYNGVPIANVVANVVDNDAPASTSIVISEIMYNPASDESAPGLGEWIEIVNTGATAVDLGGWLFDDEDAVNWGAIPMGTTLNPNQFAVFFDAAFTTAATFRAEWSVPANALVVGISWANLANGPSTTNEVLELLNNSGMQMDLVNFDDASPWPAGTVNGPSIYLTDLSQDNNDGANWARSVVGVASAISPSGGAFSTSDVGSPGRGLALPGDYNRDESVDAADYVMWRKTVGLTGAQPADGSGPTAGVPNGVVDQFDYDFWVANFGTTSESGSGGGNGGVGEVAMAVNEPTLMPTASSDEALGNISIVGPDSIRSPFRPLNSEKFSRSFGTLQNQTESEGLLLALNRVALTSEDDSFNTLREAHEDHFDEIDQCFELLDACDLMASISEF